MVQKAAFFLLRLIVTALSAAVSIVLFGMLAVMLLLSTETGREWAVGTVTPWAAAKLGYAVELEAVASAAIGEWELGRISVHKDEAFLFSAQNLHLVWSPLGMLERLEISRLSADEMVISLPAKQEEKSEESADEAFSLPEWDYPVSIENLAIDRLEIRHPALQQTQSYAVRGSFRLLTGEAPLMVELAVQSLTGPDMRLAVSTTAANGTWRLSAKLEEAAGGLVGGMLNLPGEQPLEIYLASEFGQAGEGWRITLEEFEAFYHGHILSGYAQMQLLPDVPRLNIKEAYLLIDDSKPQLLAGHLSPDDLSLVLDLTDFSLGLVGRYLNQPLTGTVSGKILLDGTPQAPVMNVAATAEGAFDEQDFTLDADFDYAPGNLQVRAAELAIQGASLSASGTLQQSQMDFAIQAKGVPTDILALSGWKLHPGRFTVDATIQGTVQNPQMNGTASYDTRFSTWEQERRTLPLLLKLAFETREEALHASLKILQSQTQVGSAQAVLPLVPYMALVTGQDNALAGSIQADFNLEHVSLFLDRALHTIEGDLKLDLKLAGELGAPMVNGELSLANGHYESRVAGTSFQDIRAQVKASGQRLAIEQATATGNGGTLSLAGHVDWSDAALANPIDLTLRAKNANIINRYDMEGYATGELTLKGGWEQANATGTVDVTPFTLLLDTFLNNEDIPSIEVTEVHVGEQAKNGQRVEQLLPEVVLDITLVADKQAFLRGYGVDAELKGEIKIAGTVAEPEFSGVIKTVRGHYEVLGKRFDLDEGRVEFQDESIFLVIPGIYERRGTEIRAVLSGSVDDLQVQLTSSPPMPEDEIVSWLLFGKSASNISPFQAIRLANAVAALRGGGKALFDPVGEVRELLNLDAITLDGSDNGGTDVTVGIGKYINDRVYLELQKGSNPTQPVKGSVEIELRPNLSLESEAGGDAGLGGVQLQWKRDY